MTKEEVVKQREELEQMLNGLHHKERKIHNEISYLNGMIHVLELVESGELTTEEKDNGRN